MEYRPLGRTGLQVSAIGLGCVQLNCSHPDYAIQMVHRALELGITFFDVARSYGDAEIKVGRGLAGHRDQVVISTKTGGKTREEAWVQINQSLERLGTDYVDNCHLHGLRAGEDLERRLGPGGALEALIEARAQGIVHHIGCTSHRSEVLIEAIRRFDFEVILVPMNLVEREPLAALIPLCQEKGIGVTIMKPLATGLLPAPPALKWLLNQPIATAVPGATTLEELQENAMVAQGDYALSETERAEAETLRHSLEHVRCRICGRCEPCPQGVSIGATLGTDVMYDHYRTMGPAQFRRFPWSRPRIEYDMAEREKQIRLIESCTHCGICETRCPYGLPVMDMLPQMLPAMADMMAFYRELLGAS